MNSGIYSSYDYMKQGKLDETNGIFETVSILEDAVQV